MSLREISFDQFVYICSTNSQFFENLQELNVFTLMMGFGASAKVQSKKKSHFGVLNAQMN